MQGFNKKSSFLDINVCSMFAT